MASGDDREFPSAAEYGRCLRGFGVNLLVRDIAQTISFLKDVFGVTLLHRSEGFAVLAYKGHQWMLHADATYHSNPLLALTGDGAIRGAGIELRLYDIDPDAAEARARERGYTILQESTNKPHGLRECYIADPDGYIWVPGIGIRDEELPESS